jgi:hypothetical protein
MALVDPNKLVIYSMTLLFVGYANTYTSQYLGYFGCLTVRTYLELLMGLPRLKPLCSGTLPYILAKLTSYWKHRSKHVDRATNPNKFYMSSRSGESNMLLSRASQRQTRKFQHEIVGITGIGYRLQ